MYKGPDSVSCQHQRHRSDCAAAKSDKYICDSLSEKYCRTATGFFLPNKLLAKSPSTFRKHRPLK